MRGTWIRSSGKAETRGTPDSVLSRQIPRDPLSQAKCWDWAGGEIEAQTGTRLGLIVVNLDFEPKPLDYSPVLFVLYQCTFWVFGEEESGNLEGTGCDDCLKPFNPEPPRPETFQP